MVPLFLLCPIDEKYDLRMASSSLHCPSPPFQAAPLIACATQAAPAATQDHSAVLRAPMAANELAYLFVNRDDVQRSFAVYILNTYVYFSRNK